MDSALPRDVLTMTPHFNTGSTPGSPQGICEELAAGVAAWMGTTVAEVRVTAYDAQGTAPVYPQGEAVVNENAAPTSQFPREVAVCLSFYSERNIPRRRGRLFVPFVAIAPNMAGNGVRPPSSTRQAVMDLADVLQAVGGLSTDWCIYSRADDAARTVTNYWVDDEWDTMRSRGLRATTRNMGTTSEA